MTDQIKVAETSLQGDVTLALNSLRGDQIHYVLGWLSNAAPREALAAIKAAHRAFPPPLSTEPS